MFAGVLTDLTDPAPQGGPLVVSVHSVPPVLNRFSCKRARSRVKCPCVPNSGSSSGFVVGHGERVGAWGFAFADRGGVEPDREAAPQRRVVHAAGGVASGAL